MVLIDDTDSIMVLLIKSVFSLSRFRCLELSLVMKKKMREMTKVEETLIRVIVWLTLKTKGMHNVKDEIIWKNSPIVVKGSDSSASQSLFSIDNK